MSSVLKKLNEARMLFQKLKINKTGENSFAGYKYFELGDFLIPALGIFYDLGLSGVISFTADLATLTITDVDSCEQVLITSPMSTASLKAAHAIQNLGAVQTYLRRYLWVAALEIVEHDAIDSSPGAEKMDVQAILRGVSNSRSLELLRANFEAAMLQLSVEHHEALTKAKNTRYRELNKPKEPA